MNSAQGHPTADETDAIFPGLLKLAKICRGEIQRNQLRQGIFNAYSIYI